ncbi:polysaccharide biosynthesis/export family protein [Pelobacter propionicus]|uniref:Polysaccharide export protein n=1 Tax=Pelobacter propionicus (strain DSM 2379 / NBRC 103807 / OttBd1) TaxID=338966 RepID=A1AT08_PELPD|nr:polysaccharide biosynthesis/export family protein [Pelobacter propionicus]ABL00479.1 polysaccharide export protein [Pelobacter propionicus DSM 2379]
MKALCVLQYILIALMLTACATTVNNPVPVQSSIQVSDSSAQEYRIRAGDLLDVKFFYNSELNEQVTVRPDGRISLQLANDLMAGGLTPAELTEQLKKKYASEIDNPEITVIVRSFSYQRIFVDGEVFRAGLIPLVGQMTVLQSITQAGGKKDTAYLKGVIVIRRTPGDKLVTMQLNLEDALDNTDMTQDIALLPNDIVFVPKSTIANVNVWVDQYIRRNIPVSMGLSPF